MAFVVYNTLTRKKEEFIPINQETVKIYSCGPTVYNFAHIGNHRSYVFADLLRRYLKFKGFRVFHVMNITDVDDKTIRDSQKENKTLKEFTDYYTKEFFKDMNLLNIEKFEVYPRATEHIKEMVELIKKLIEKGYAYQTSDGSWYYDISKFKDYGKLSHISLENLKAGARVKQDEYDKNNPSDFALWKSWDEEDGDVYWETEIGKGRPGWHIECSAMSTKYLGDTFDIHTGGVDLIFPHHENEIAQSEAATGKKFVNYWMHNEHLLVDGKKMSKSLGNFYTLRDLLNKNINPIAIRYTLLTTHYRQQLNFTFESVEAAANSVRRLQDFIVNVRSASGVDEDVSGLIKETLDKFTEAMDDDLNISVAVSYVFEFIKEINKRIREGKIGENNKKAILQFMERINTVLGVIDFSEDSLDEEAMALIKEREKARANKEWSKADEIRDKLKEMGIIVEDTKEGTRWKKIQP